MVKRMTAICVSLGLLFLGACQRGDGPGGVRVNTLKNFSVHTDQAVYGSGEKEIEIILNNDTARTWSYDVSYSLQALRSEGWTDVNKGDTVVWIQVIYTIQPGGSAEISVPLTVYIDNIPPGQYRIVKPVMSKDGREKHYICANFLVAE
jgi:hypothetical protein